MGKTVDFCYGDSNTYGYDPKRSGERYPEQFRWTTILQKLLGENYTVISEGKNGRTTAFDRPGEERNGLNEFLPRLRAHEAPDIVLIMLGTNDCCKPMGLTPQSITDGLEKLVVAAEKNVRTAKGEVPKIVLIAPAAIGEHYEGTIFAYQLDENAVHKSRALPAYYRNLAEKHGCLFLDATDLATSPRDCEHLTEESHKTFAERIFNLLKENDI